MLTGKIPTGLDGQTWDSPAAWFEDHREILTGEAQKQTGETEGTKFNGAFRSTLMRYWRTKKPKGDTGTEKPRPTPHWEPPQRPPGDERLIADMTDEELEQVRDKGREIFPH